MHRVSANKNVLSSRLNSVRQMSCCHSSAGRLFHMRDRVPQVTKIKLPDIPLTIFLNFGALSNILHYTTLQGGQYEPSQYHHQGA